MKEKPKFQNSGILPKRTLAQSIAARGPQTYTDGYGTEREEYEPKYIKPLRDIYHTIREILDGKDYDLSDEEYIEKYGKPRPIGSSGMLGFLVAPEFEGLEFPEITAQHFGSIAKPKSIVEFGPVKGATIEQVPTKVVKAKSIAKPKFSKAMKQTFKERTGFDIESAPVEMQERELTKGNEYVKELRKKHKIK